MKITALLILKCIDADNSSSSGPSDPVVLSNATDVSHFGFFQRSAAKEFILFVSRTVTKRTPPGQRQSVQHEEYKVHCYNRNGLCAMAFMDDHYPVRSAFSLLNKVLDEYQKSFGESWRTVQTDATESWPYLNEALTKFQDPAEADKLLKIQRDLDETKVILMLSHIVSQNYLVMPNLPTCFYMLANGGTAHSIGQLSDHMHKTIDSVLERGVKLDNLVEKSSDLSAASQMFYKQAKKTNQCCTLV